MAVLRLTPEQAQQLEEVLSSVLSKSPGEGDEALRALHEKLVNTRKQASKPQGAGPVKCANCGREFVRGPRRRQARYCSPQCSAKAYRKRRYGARAASESAATTG
jgi:predicted Zn-ribbon and HTH transcriptional regulator